MPLELKLVGDLGEAPLVGLLLLLLLALGAVGHVLAAVLEDLRLQVLLQPNHLPILLLDPIPQIIVVALRTNLFLHLEQRAQVVLKLRQEALDLHVVLP